jgi:5-methylcytosine-specific restriction endonuclease McrA
LCKKLCGQHYQAERAHGSLSRSCKGCGAVLSGRGSHEYCSPGCRPDCTIADCDTPAEREHGTLCLGHFAQKQRYGEAKPFLFKWTEPQPCIVCGDPPTHGLRRFCSRACFQADRAYGDDLLLHGPCVRCGSDIAYLYRNESGQRRYRLRTLCLPCAKRSTHYALNVRELAQRDGTDCALCLKPVDMSLRKSDPGGFMCPSIDHITPRSRGGLDEAANLQLAHLLCNIRKGTRVQRLAVEVMP